MFWWERKTGRFTDDLASIVMISLEFHKQGPREIRVFPIVNSLAASINVKETVTIPQSLNFVTLGTKKSTPANSHLMTEKKRKSIFKLLNQVS